jgi:hypothetical protein
VGKVDGVIEGKATLRKGESNRAILEGTLSNATGHKLRNVYIAYNDPQQGDDEIFFMPVWEKGTSIKLEDDFAFKSTRFASLIDGTINARTDQGFRLQNTMGRRDDDTGWAGYWYKSDPSLRNSSMNVIGYDDAGREVPKSFPMMSLFRRLPPMRNARQQSDRSEILHRAGRYLDVSDSVAAGRLVVLAEADGQSELPFPLEVEGEKIHGHGKLYYQCTLPLDHVGGTELPTTQPLPEQPKSAASTEFDPATYKGNGSELSAQDRDAWRRYQMQQRRGTAPPRRR